MASSLPDVLITCSTCGERKGSDEFYVKDARGVRRGRCKSCTSTYQAARYREVGRNRHLLRTFGITAEEYDRMLALQGGACAVCRADSTRDDRAFRVDHDHVSGRIRGLLCHSCNVAIGLMKDNVAVLAAAITYLECSRAAARD